SARRSRTRIPAIQLLSCGSCLISRLPFTKPLPALHPLAPAYRLSAVRHNALASPNATPATAAAASPISGRSRPVSADAGIVVVHAIGIRYTNRNRSAPGYAETG